MGEVGQVVVKFVLVTEQAEGDLMPVVMDMNVDREGATGLERQIRGDQRQIRGDQRVGAEENTDCCTVKSHWISPL